jgi:hypothetical protein
LPSAAVISASRFRLSGAGEAVSGIKVSYREIAAFGATYTTLANALARDSCKEWAKHAGKAAPGPPGVT